MDFKTFQSNLKVLDKQTGNTIRSKYINEFVNTEHADPLSVYGL